VVEALFKGKNVFVTGATGFVGKVLLEKLVRSCPEVGTIFCLVRPKKNLQPSARLDSFLNNQVL